MRLLFILIRDAVIISVLLSIFAISIYGVRLPYQFPISTVGPYELAAFDTGLAMYQFGRTSPFFSLSPLNDFILYTNGDREVHLGTDTFEAEEFTTNITPDKITQISQAITSYFKLTTPTYILETDELKATYTSKIEENSVTIQKDVTFFNFKQLRTNGMTFSYASNDILFNPETQFVYSDITDEQLAYLRSHYNKNFRKLNRYFDSLTVVQREIKLLNPDVPGVLTITADENQRMVVNNRFRLIEISEPIDPKADTHTMNLTIRASELPGPGGV